LTISLLAMTASGLCEAIRGDLATRPAGSQKYAGGKAGVFSSGGVHHAGGQTIHGLDLPTRRQALGADAGGRR
jgi:hypothetical protein